MRTTVTLDDGLVEEFTGITDRTSLLKEPLQALVAREAVRRIMALGGSDPTAKAGPRRRPLHFLNPQ